MHYKLFVRYLLKITISLLGILFLFIFLIDPYNLTPYNILNIEYKLIRDNKIEKNNILEKNDIKFDNIILGSSRAESLSPTYLSKTTNQKSFNFALGGTNIDASLQSIYFLENISKLPKSIFLCIDFTNFIEIIQDNKSEKESLENNIMISKNNTINKIFSIDALKAAFRTFKYHIKGKKPNVKIDNDGSLIVFKKEILGKKEKIEELAKQYYNLNYRKGKVQVSSKQLEKIRIIKKITNKYGINLYIMLTPVHERLYTLIIENKKLNLILSEFKEELRLIYPYYDAMILNEITTNSNNFFDAVHYSEKAGNRLLYNIIEFYNHID